MKRSGTAIVVALLLAAWLGFWFWPTDDATRAVQLESEIGGLELERRQVAANAFKRQLDLSVAGGYVLVEDPPTAVLLAEAERMTQQLDLEMVKAIDARLGRLRAHRSEFQR